MKLTQELMTEQRRGPAVGTRSGGGVAQSELRPHKKDYLGNGHVVTEIVTSWLSQRLSHHSCANGEIHCVSLSFLACFTQDLT